MSRSFSHGMVMAGALVATPALLAAQDTTGAKVPVRQLAPVEARSAQALGAVQSLRALPDGGTYVYDNQKRQILLFDAALKNAKIIADSTPGSQIQLTQRSAGLLSYLGDSTIVVDPSTMSMLILTPQGKIARIMASPRPNDIYTLAGTNLGAHAFDTKGQLVYRQGFGGGANMAAMFGSGMDRGGRPGGNNNQGGNSNQGRGGQQGPQGQQGGRGGDMGGFGGSGFGGGGFGGQPGGQGGPGGRGFNPQNQPDSMPVVRVNFDTRKPDSVAWVKVPKNETAMSRGDDGSMRFTAKINPLPQGDDWALLADGTVAVVRVLDYHIDWYTPDGKHEASPRIPFAWKRISDDDKVKLVDSLKVMAKAIADRTGAQGNNNRMNFEVIAPEKLPDYYPPVRAGASQADLDGNLWILPTTSSLAAQLSQQMMMGAGRGGPPAGMMGGAPSGVAGGPPGGAAGAAVRDTSARGARGAAPGDTTGRGGRGGRGGMEGLAAMMPSANQPPLVYDVVDRKGELIHRVQLPPGRQLVGFGPKGAIYLLSREGREVWLERTRLAN